LISSTKDFRLQIEDSFLFHFLLGYSLIHDTSLQKEASQPEDTQAEQILKKN
jgi:hypothetical protein